MRAVDVFRVVIYQQDPCRGDARPVFYGLIESGIRLDSPYSARGENLFHSLSKSHVALDILGTARVVVGPDHLTMLAKVQPLPNFMIRRRLMLEPVGKEAVSLFIRTLAAQPLGDHIQKVELAAHHFRELARAEHHFLEAHRVQPAIGCYGGSPDIGFLRQVPIQDAVKIPHHKIIGHACHSDSFAPTVLPEPTRQSVKTQRPSDP